MIDYFRKQLAQPTTWRGIVALVTACGVKLSPELQDSIIAAGLALMGLIGIVADEHKAAKQVAARVAEETATETAAITAEAVAQEVVAQQPRLD
jgi:uncharacterized membrane protein